MSADFTFMDAMHVTNDDVAEITLYRISLPNGKNPTLIGRHGGETNKPYFNALLKAMAKRARIVQSGKLNAEMLQENRDEDLKLYPQYVITDWRDVCDASGNDVAFTQEALAQFLKHLPNHVFDEVRNFFGNADNFMGDIPIIEEIQTKGKRSPSK